MGLPTQESCVLGAPCTNCRQQEKDFSLQRWTAALRSFGRGVRGESCKRMNPLSLPPLPKREELDPQQKARVASLPLSPLIGFVFDGGTLEQQTTPDQI